MTRCPNCEGNVFHAGLYCPVCTAPIDHSQGFFGPTCSQCGNAIYVRHGKRSYRVHFCPHCRAHLSDEGLASSNNTSPPVRAFIRITCVLAGVFLICIGTYATLSGELKTRTGKPTSEGFARIYGVVLAGFGIYVVTLAFQLKNKE